MEHIVALVTADVRREVAGIMATVPLDYPAPARRVWERRLLLGLLKFRLSI